MSTLYNPRSGWCNQWVYDGQNKPGHQAGSLKSKPCTRIINGCFCEYVALLQTAAEKNYSASFPTQNARTITIFVKNTGASPATFFLQNSPNGLDFIGDPQLLELEPNETGYLVPYIFSKYTRIVGQGAEPSTAYIWVQMQNHSYLYQD